MSISWLDVFRRRSAVSVRRKLSVNHWAKTGKSRLEREPLNPLRPRLNSAVTFPCSSLERYASSRGRWRSTLSRSHGGRWRAVKRRSTSDGHET